MEDFDDYKRQYGNTDLWKSLLEDRSDFAYVDNESKDCENKGSVWSWEDYVCYVFKRLNLFWEYRKCGGDPCVIFLISPDKKEVGTHDDHFSTWHRRGKVVRKGWKVLRYIYLSDLYGEKMKDYSLVDEEE